MLNVICVEKFVFPNNAEEKSTDTFQNCSLAKIISYCYLPIYFDLTLRFRCRQCWKPRCRNQRIDDIGRIRRIVRHISLGARIPGSAEPGRWWGVEVGMANARRGCAVERSNGAASEWAWTSAETQRPDSRTGSFRLIFIWRFSASRTRRASFARTIATLARECFGRVACVPVGPARDAATRDYPSVGPYRRLILGSRTLRCPSIHPFTPGRRG